MNDVLRMKHIPTGEVWVFTKQEDDTYNAVSESDGYFLTGFHLHDMRRWVAKGLYQFVT